MTRRDDGLLDGAAVDAFVMGGCEAEVSRGRFDAVNDNGVTFRTSDAGCVAPEAVSVALVACSGDPEAEL